MTHPKLRRLLAIKNTGVRFCKKSSSRARRVSHKHSQPKPRYGISKPLPRNYKRRAQGILRRLEANRYIQSNGTLRQLLANNFIVQLPRLEKKRDDVIDRLTGLIASIEPEEYEQFQQDFRQWHREGSPETKQNTFWRIRYCGLIELLREFRHWDTIYKIHQARKARGLRSALDEK